MELADLRAKVAEYERKREQDQSEIQQRDVKLQQLVGELRALVIRKFDIQIYIGHYNIQIRKWRLYC